LSVKEKHIILILCRLVEIDHCYAIYVCVNCILSLDRRAISIRSTSLAVAYQYRLFHSIVSQQQQK